MTIIITIVTPNFEQVRFFCIHGNSRRSGSFRSPNNLGVGIVCICRIFTMYREYVHTISIRSICMRLGLASISGRYDAAITAAICVCARGNLQVIGSDTGYTTVICQIRPNSTDFLLPLITWCTCTTFRRRRQTNRLTTQILIRSCYGHTCRSDTSLASGDIFRIASC